MKSFRRLATTALLLSTAAALHAEPATRSAVLPELATSASLATILDRLAAVDSRQSIVTANGVMIEAGEPETLVIRNNADGTRSVFCVDSQAAVRHILTNDGAPRAAAKVQQ
jgi:hypothetical protein